jgi:putative tricarboxylic transport membrane protein
MGTMELIQSGIVILLRPENIGMLTVGTCIGIIAGSIPGLSANNTTAMLLPITLVFPMETALIFIGAVYVACQYGGSITAILINTPGTSGAIATTLDGFPLCRKGKADYAMGLSLGSSTVGGLIAGVICLVIMKPIAVYALKFGTAELFLLALLGICIIVSISEKKPIKGGLAGAMGLLIAAMPAEPTLARVRLTFGFFELYDGIPLVAAMCGFFAFPAMISLVGNRLIVGVDTSGQNIGIKGIAQGCWDSFVKWPVLTVYSTLIGLVVGIMPGAGVNASALLAYSQAQTWSKNSKEFGNGAPEGVIAPEAANNATAPGALVPAIALGIPGSATTAVLLAAMTLHGVNPGPKVMELYPREVYALFVSVLAATVLMFILGFFYTAACSKLSTVNMAYMIPGVLAVCIVGAFVTRGLLFDSYLFIVFGIIGTIMVSNGYMYAPLVLGIVMGKIAEENFAIAIKISRGDFSIFFSSAICWIAWIILVVVMIVPPILKKRRKKESPL